MNYGYQLIDGYDTLPLLRGYGSSSALFPGSADMFMQVFAKLLGAIIIAIIVVTVLQIIGMWKIFKKAGEKSWKSIIPFYNIAILYKISGMSPYLVFIYILLFVPILNIFASIAIVIFDLYQKINLMKAFKSSTSLTVAMFIAPHITYLILGFGKSTYYGLEETKKPKSTIVE